MRQTSLHSSRNHAIATFRGATGRVLPLAVALAACCAAAPAIAAVYKWTDATGRVVYSDQPPPTNVKVETLNAPPPPANPNAAKDLAQQNVDLRKREAQRADADKKQEKSNADAQLRRTQCTQVQGHIGQLSASQEIVYRVNEKGERIAMDDTARRREIEQLQTWLRENCGG